MDTEDANCDSETSTTRIRTRHISQKTIAHMVTFSGNDYWVIINAFVPFLGVLFLYFYLNEFDVKLHDMLMTKSIFCKNTKTTLQKMGITALIITK